MKRIILLLAFTPFFAIAQPDVIASGGNYYEASNVQISYTIGQTVTATVGNNSVNVTQGFQQPEYVITDVSNDENVLDVNIYPNPAIADVTVEFTHLPSVGVTVYLIDNSGKIIYTEKVTATSFKLGMKSYPSGVYYFKVNYEDKTGVYKIIKK